MSPCRWITNPSTLWVIGNVLRKYRRGLRQGSPLPPGGDVAVAREPDDEHWFFRIPDGRLFAVQSEELISMQIQPLLLGDDWPEPSDLDLCGRCWFWHESAWHLIEPDGAFRADIPWLPHWAIADPSAEP